MSGEKIEVESEKGRSRLVRAAARDARWKTQLMLDPLQGSRRGECGTTEQARTYASHFLFLAA